LVILCISHKTTTHSEDGGINGAVVIVTLYACLSFVGHVTGGCLNPAVGVGLIGMANIFGSDYKKVSGDNEATKIGYDNCKLNGFWIMLVGPLLGGILAGVFYMLMHRP